jgi:hypothetical protein
MFFLDLFAQGIAVSAEQSEDGLRWRPLLGNGYS